MTCDTCHTIPTLDYSPLRGMVIETCACGSGPIRRRPPPIEAAHKPVNNVKLRYPSKSHPKKADRNAELIAYYATHSMKACAAKFGIAVGAAHAVITRAGVAKRRQGKQPGGLAYVG
jgi:hypothetical protein